MKAKLFLALIIFGAGSLISNAQQIIDNDLQVGKDLPTFQTGYGKKLYLSGTHNNTDLMWIARYNRANNQTDFRFNIGDDNSGDDRFVIGNNVSPSTTWRDLFVVSNNGKVGIGTSNPIGTLHLNATSPVLAMTYPEGGSAVIRSNTNVWVMGIQGKVGIEDVSLGTQSGEGQRTLTLAAGGAARLKILANGNIGIGTSTPQAKLDVNGTTKTGFLDCNDITLNSTKSVLARLYEGSTDGEGTYLGVKSYATQPVSTKMFSLEHKFYGYLNSSIDFYRGGSTTGGYIGFTINNGSQMARLNSNGLEVAGIIKAREVKVEVNAGADHVFKSDYNLRKLEEVEAFVKENKHLPEIPSEKEMQEKGLSVNEFQIKLLQKIEELTLYVIDLEKQVKDLKHHQNK
jgi:hypothetical protein